MHGGTVCECLVIATVTIATRHLLCGVMLTVEGYHVPAVRHRDAFYHKLEEERESAIGQK